MQQAVQDLFERGINDGRFTDYDVCIQSPSESCTFAGGKHVDDGAMLFDIASLTKALTHLLFLKLFAEKELTPEQRYADLVEVPQGNERQLWHFLCYVVQSYLFDYEALRAGQVRSFRSVLKSNGFGHWGKRFKYDNVSSAYLAIMLEHQFGADLEQIFHEVFYLDQHQRNQLLFHPVQRSLVLPDSVVPTVQGSHRRGFVHDPLSFSHQTEHISVAGVFSTAEVLAAIFHQEVDKLIASGFYSEVAQNQLPKLGIQDRTYGLGFDIPYRKSLEDCSVEDPLIFAGWTGCRLFFARKPRVTICFLTNRTFCGETEESRLEFSRFSWNVIRTVLRQIG